MIKNKKSAAWIEKVVSITLVLVVLFIIYMFLPQNILNSGKEFYNKVWMGELTMNYSEADNTAQNAFDNMIKQIEKCQNTKSPSPCLCSVNLRAFYPFYKFKLSHYNIEMINTKGETPIYVKEGKTPPIACYIDENGKTKSIEYILFENIGKPYIIEKKFSKFLKDKKLWINPMGQNLIKFPKEQEHTPPKICWVLENPESKLPKNNKECAV